MRHKNGCKCQTCNPLSYGYDEYTGYDQIQKFYEKFLTGDLLLPYENHILKDNIHVIFGLDKDNPIVRSLWLDLCLKRNKVAI